MEIPVGLLKERPRDFLLRFTSSACKMDVDRTEVEEGEDEDIG
jgi:hypothetical protein